MVPIHIYGTWKSKEVCGRFKVIIMMEGGHATKKGTVFIGEFKPLYTMEGVLGM